MAQNEIGLHTAVVERLGLVRRIRVHKPKHLCHDAALAVLVPPSTGIVDGVVAARAVDGEDSSGAVLCTDLVEVLREVRRLAEDVSEPAQVMLNVHECKDVRIVAEGDKHVDVT